METIDESEASPQQIDIDILAQGVAIAKAVQVAGDGKTDDKEDRGNLLHNLTKSLAPSQTFSGDDTPSAGGVKSTSTGNTSKVRWASMNPEDFVGSQTPALIQQSIDMKAMYERNVLARQRTKVASEMKAQAKERRDREKQLTAGSKLGGAIEEKKKKYNRFGMRKKVYVLMLIGVIISLALLKAPDSGNWNDFGPRKTMKTGNEANAAFLAISRLTAYAMYPCLILVFISKCQFTRTHLFATQVSLYLRMEQGHHLHVFVGWWVFYLTWLHCIFHVIRWIRREEMHYIYEHQTGITGLIAWIASCLIVLPMGIRRLRRSVPWELRKHAHTVLGVTFGISIALHAPATNIAWVCGSMVAVYGADWLYVQTLNTFLVKSSHFHRLTDGVVMYFENPPGFVAPEGGYYLNLCVPFISRYQWHALTVYPHPDQPNSSCVCIINNGDWSKALHQDTEWHTVRPVWVQGPFLSPYAAVLHYDNAICVASGSGLTAALGALHSLRDDRRINLIWICRDPSMVEFYLNTISFDHNAFTMVFYTGKRQLMVNRQLPETTLVFEERPDIRGAICMIIHMIESEDFLPEALLDDCDRRRDRMHSIAAELQDLEGTGSALETLERLLARAMQKYTIGELMTKLNPPEDNMSEEDLDKLLIDVFNIQLSEDTVRELLEELEAQGSSPDKSSSKQKLMTFCKKAIDKYVEGRSATPGNSESMNPQDLKAKFSAHQGSQDLRALLGDIPTTVAEKRLGRWSVCYCGGSAPVNKELKRVCKDFGIEYHQEGFEW